jgi:hypothetical protein
MDKPDKVLNLNATSTELREVDDGRGDDHAENQSLRRVFQSNKEEALDGLLQIRAVIHESEIVGDGDLAADGLKRALWWAKALCSQLETMKHLKRIVARI